MTRKVFLIALAFGLLIAGTAMASGQKDQAAPTIPGATGQRLTVSGTLSFVNLIHPTLKSADKVYELFVPRYLVNQAAVKEGATVSVEGYLVQGTPAATATDDGNIDLFVTKATIDGKDYDLSQYRGQMMGGRGGRGAPGRGGMGLGRTGSGGMMYGPGNRF